MIYNETYQVLMVLQRQYKKFFQTAANAFLGYLGVNDQSGLVSFADSANMDKQLNNDHNATQVAVNNLATGGATNIGEAIAFGTAELGSERANPRPK